MLPEPSPSFACHVPDPLCPSPQSSRDFLKAETQNISSSFKDLDAQVSSEQGYAPKANAAPKTGARAPRTYLSTQKMYEFKTRLRCSCEEYPGQGRVGEAAGHHGKGTSGHLALPQMWWTKPSSAAASGLTRSMSTVCCKLGSRSFSTCFASP